MVAFLVSVAAELPTAHTGGQYCWEKGMQMKQETKQQWWEGLQMGERHTGHCGACNRCESEKDGRRELALA